MPLSPTCLPLEHAPALSACAASSLSRPGQTYPSARSNIYTLGVVGTFGPSRRLETQPIETILSILPAASLSWQRAHPDVVKRVTQQLQHFHHPLKVVELLEERCVALGHVHDAVQHLLQRPRLAVPSAGRQHLQRSERTRSVLVSCNACLLLSWRTTPSQHLIVALHSCYFRGARLIPLLAAQYRALTDREIQRSDWATFSCAHKTN